jgi:uroporphyrinogen-III decarboxylase
MTNFFNEQEKLGEKGLMMISLSDPICVAAELFEMGNFLIYALTEPEKIKYLLDAINERQMVELDMILKHNVKDVIFRICGPEYATPPYLSPEYFHNYVNCYLIEICRKIKDAGGIPRIHCHGKIRKVIDQFALTEAMALDPIEPPPDGDIDLSELKRLYGKRFCFFGNIELKELETSDVHRIDYLVKKAMEDAKEGSGFVLMPTAAPINVPLSNKTKENYIQYIGSALQYGKY